ncbi:hypothetical protein ACSD7O_20260 [Methylorubrum extorquens]|uniref:hypothetical protein n=1 Tax=Methylorubrum extorquens TaxID=408 RepID=UPI003F5DF262
MSAYRHLCDAAKKDKIAAWNQDLTSAKNYDIFGGHYQLRNLTDIDCNILAFFREPIARVYSYYNYAQTLTEFEIIRHRELAAAEMRRLSLEDCLNSENADTKYELSNYYCKTLFGKDYQRSDIIDESGRLNNFAKSIISQVDFVGCTELFEHSINLMLSSLGLSQPKMMHREKDIKDLRADTALRADFFAKDATWHKVASLNQDDVILYEYLTSRMNNEMYSPPDPCFGDFPIATSGRELSFSNSMKVYHNALYSGWHNPEDGVWSDGTSGTIAFDIISPIKLISVELELPINRNFLSTEIDVVLDGISFQRVHVIMTNESIKLDNFRPDDLVASMSDKGKVAIFIPVPNYKMGVVELKISTNRIYIPSEFFDTGDSRRLGYKIHSVKFFKRLLEFSVVECGQSNLQT